MVRAAIAGGVVVVLAQLVGRWIRDRWREVDIVVDVVGRRLPGV